VDDSENPKSRFSEVEPFYKLSVRKPRSFESDFPGNRLFSEQFQDYGPDPVEPVKTQDASAKIGHTGTAPAWTLAL